jgi:hypothetical protein
VSVLCLDCTGYLYPESARCLVCSAQPNMTEYIEVPDISPTEQRENIGCLIKMGIGDDNEYNGILS